MGDKPYEYICSRQPKNSKKSVADSKEEKTASKKISTASKKISTASKNTDAKANGSSSPASKKLIKKKAGDKSPKMNGHSGQGSPNNAPPLRSIQVRLRQGVDIISIYIYI